MRKVFTAVLCMATLAGVCQPKKAPKMAPTTSPGYYVNAKGDTVRGNVQTNPDDPTDLYKAFNFSPPKGGKLMPVTPKKAKAFGFDDHHFVVLNHDGEDVYIERLTSGRLNFYEFKYNGKVDGYPAVVADYFAQDVRAEGEDAELKNIKKISNKFYKKDLKPYLKDQPQIWTDLDKFTFNRGAVISAINEFNKYYTVAPEPKE